MSTTDEDFLTPRGLLVQGSFVCDGPSFKEFQTAVDASLNLPYTQDRFMYWCGISQMGWNIVWPLLCPFSDPGIVSHNEKLFTQLNPIVNTCYAVSLPGSALAHDLFLSPRY